MLDQDLDLKLRLNLDLLSINLATIQLLGNNTLSNIKTRKLLTYTIILIYFLIKGACSSRHLGSNVLNQARVVYNRNRVKAS